MSYHAKPYRPFDIRNSKLRKKNGINTKLPTKKVHGQTISKIKITRIPNRNDTNNGNTKLPKSKCRFKENNWL